MKVTSLINTVVAPLVLMATTAHAGVVVVETQDDFDAAGEVISRFDFDHTRFRPNTDYTNFTMMPIAGAYFIDVAGVNVVRHDGAPNVLTGGYGTGMDGYITDSTVDMVGFQVGHTHGWAMADFTVTTDKGNQYTFNERIMPTWSEIRFLGFKGTDGETISAIHFDSRIGITDIQLGVQNIAAVPEPSGYALMGAGLALLGFVARRKKAAE